MSEISLRALILFILGTFALANAAVAPAYAWDGGVGDRISVSDFAWNGGVGDF